LLERAWVRARCGAGPAGPRSSTQEIRLLKKVCAHTHTHAHTHTLTHTHTHKQTREVSLPEKPSEGGVDFRAETLAVHQSAGGPWFTRLNDHLTRRAPALEPTPRPLQTGARPTSDPSGSDKQNGARGGAPRPDTRAPAAQPLLPPPPRTPRAGAPADLTGGCAARMPLRPSYDRGSGAPARRQPQGQAACLSIHTRTRHCAMLHGAAAKNGPRAKARAAKL
jgi:hypothetical protein